eukprot:gene3612-674_t
MQGSDRSLSSKEAWPPPVSVISMAGDPKFQTAPPHPDNLPPPASESEAACSSPAMWVDVSFSLGTFQVAPQLPTVQQEVNLVTQSFTCDLRIRLYWTCPAPELPPPPANQGLVATRLEDLAYRYGGGARTKAPVRGASPNTGGAGQVAKVPFQALLDQWDPQFIFPNLAGSDLPLPSWAIVGWVDGGIQAGLGYTFLRAEKYELVHFPFDCQDFHIRLGSNWDSTVVQFRLWQDRKSTYLEQDAVLQDWLFFPPRFLAVGSPEAKGDPPLLSDPRHSAVGCRYSSCYVTGQAARRTGFYNWNIFLPLFILNLLSFSYLFVPPADLADRLSILLTLLLTTIAFKLVIAFVLPQIPYLTFLDIYFIAGLSMSLLQVAEATFASFWATCDKGAGDPEDVRRFLWCGKGSRWDRQDIERFESWWLLFAISIYVVLNVLFFASGLYFKHKFKKHAQLLSGKQPQIAD